MHVPLATAAALIALAFACSTYERWLAGRRRHELAWSISLGFFSLAAFALAAGAALGWHPVTFRLFYLFGAIVNVPFLAVGTVYLLAGRRRGDQVGAGVALMCAFATGVVMVSPLSAPLPVDTLARGSEVFGPAPRILAAVASSAGAFVVFAGAIWSAIRYRRGRMFWANLLIALGTVVLSTSGLLNSVLDEMDGFTVTLVAGISVIFAGFLVAAGGRGTTTPNGLRAVRAPDEMAEALGQTAGAEAARSAVPAEAASRRAPAATRARR